MIITRDDLGLIADRSARGALLVAQLTALACHCKAKTTVVPSKQLSLEEVLTLDCSPFGAMVIKDQDVTLGLPLASPCSTVLPLTEDASPSSSKRRKLAIVADKHFNKIFHKLQNRACKLLSTLTSGPYRALYWTTYCQSMLYFFSSCFDLSKTRLKKIYRLQQKVIIGRPWIQGHHLADVFSVFKIGPCCNLVASLERAKVSMCLRYYGLQQVCDAPDI